MVPSLACPMPLNELKAASWAFKTKAAALQQSVRPCIQIRSCWWYLWIEYWFLEEQYLTPKVMWIHVKYLEIMWVHLWQSRSSQLLLASISSLPKEQERAIGSPYSCHPSSCCNWCISTEIELFLLWGANIWVFARCKYTLTTSGMRSHKHSNLRSITIDIHTKHTAERKSDSTDHIIHCKTLPKVETTYELCPEESDNSVNLATSIWCLKMVS
jgi:hypothetical protein